jgi:uncharacterized phage-like protein YoqJ
VILSGTGHRKWGGGYGKNGVAVEVVARTKAKLTELQPTKVLSGMALGFDQWLAWLCGRAGIPFEACLPFEGQEQGWPMEARWRYDDLLKRALMVHVVGQPPKNRWEAAKAMQARNEFMVDRSDVLLAAWTGADGGTANCVRYAERVGKRVVRVGMEGL